MLTLHSLTLKNVAGVESARLELDDRGVAVVYGPNEAGKSTLLKAFEVLLSDIKTSSSAKAVRWMYPKDVDESPVIAAVMTVGEYRLDITKTFKKSSGQAVLRVSSPAVENLTGRQAEERLQEILAEGMDHTLRDALTIRQGESLETFVAADVESLAQTLEEGEEGGSSLSGSSESSALVARVNKEFRRYFTEGGSVASKGELRLAQIAVEEAEDAVAEARENYEQAVGHIEAIDQISRSLEAEKLKKPEAHAELEKCAEELKAAQEVEQKLELLTSTADAAARRLELAESRVAAREKLVAEVKKYAAKIARVENAVEASQQAVDTEQTEARTREERVKQASLQLNYSEAVLRVGQALIEVQNVTEDVTSAKQLADKVTRLFAQRDEVKEKVDANPADQPTITAYREALSELRTAERFRDAVATTVEVNGPSDAVVISDGRDDQELGESGATFQVTSARTLRLGEFEVTVTPSADISHSERDVERAQSKLQELSENLDIESGDLAAAEKLAAQRSDLIAELQRLDTSVASATGGRSRDIINAAVDDSESGLERVQQELGIWLDKFNEQPKLVASDEIAEAVQTADEIVQHARAIQKGGAVDPESDPIDLADAIERVESWNDQTSAFLRQGSAQSQSMSSAQQKHFKLQAELEQLQVTSAQQVSTLEQARGETSDEELAKDAEQAQTDSDKAQAAVQESRASLGDNTVEFARDRYAGAQTRIRQIEGRIQQWQVDRAQRQGQLDKGIGAAAEVEEAERELEQTTRSFGRVEAQAAAAKMLRDTIEDARAELRARYEKPFKEAFEGLASAVFGAGTSFTFDADLGVEKRVRAGIDLEAEALSGGAQEQIMMLARLAVATLVGGGDGVPIFIDDALGFSDPDRMRSMNAVLGRLGREHQVIVLTCDVDRFDNIAGAEQFSMDSVKSG